MKRDLLKDGFQRADFPCDCAATCNPTFNDGHYDWCPATDATDTANTILRECLGEPVRVRGSIQDDLKGGAFYVDDGVSADTHTAYLVCREKVEVAK
jgi:hypothetical protein